MSRSPESPAVVGKASLRPALTLGTVFLLGMQMTDPCAAQEILHHEIHLRLWPQEARLEGDCVLNLSPPAAEGAEISLQLLDGVLHGVEIAGRPVDDVRYEEQGESTAAYDYRLLTIPLPLAEGDGPLRVRVRYADDDLHASAENPEDGQPFSLGQIDDEAGSFASHLAWYPYQPHAGLGAEIFLTVPDDLVAISSGELVEVDRSEAGWITYHWHTDHASGILPYPFAVHRYSMLGAIGADDRTRLSIHYLPDDESFARPKLQMIQEIFGFYLDVFGSYPFTKLAVVETDLLEGNIGLAAQSVVMLSRKVWFAAPLDPNDTSLANRPLLVLADEIAHQWNAYKVASPNYLAEGISRYTDSLYMAHRAAAAEGAGPEDGERVIAEQMKQTCQSYLALASKVPDVAISDPHVTPALYFLKGALALDLLRSRIGPQRFMKAMRGYFTGEAGKVTRLEDLAGAFEEVCGEPLGWHFEQWYRQAGHPLLAYTWRATPASTSVYTIDLDLEQTQQGEPYRLLLPVEVRDGAGNSESTTIELTDGHQSFNFMVNIAPRELVLDPQGRIPIETTRR